MSTAPFTLAGFTPIQRIGRGGFGEVWVARQDNVDREVAIKVGHEPITDHTAQRRFERECVALGRLTNHPNIIDVHTVGQLPDGRPFLVLEYVSGGTLWDRFQTGPIGESELLVIAREIADALDVAHRAGIIHRDLKPENILLRPNGQAVLGDFGIARLHDGTNTTAQAVTASVAYAAPEVLAGEPPGPRSDLYGIGICLVAAAIRDVPFVHSTDQSIPPILHRVLNEAPPDLVALGYSRPFAELVSRLVAKDPAQRPPDAAAVIGEIRALEGHPPGAGGSGGGPHRPPEADGRATVVASSGSPSPTGQNHPTGQNQDYSALPAPPSASQPSPPPQPSPGSHGPQSSNAFPGAPGAQLPPTGTAPPQQPPVPPAQVSPPMEQRPMPPQPVARTWPSGNVPTGAPSGAWQSGPAYPVRPRRRSSGCLIALLILGVLTLAVGGCTVLVFNSVQAPVHTTNDFYAALDDGRYQDAYDLMCPETRPADLSSFQLQVSSGAASITNYSFFTSTTAGTVPDTAVIEGTVELDGLSYPSTVNLTEHSDGWKVCSYTVP
ncbi:MAG: serine/threonine-protein kinase [Acidimicrobiales bacterium]